MGLSRARLDATAGDFVYEAPGEAHTLVAYESDEPRKVHFNVTGPVVWLDENGEATGQLDVIEAALVESLMR